MSEERKYTADEIAVIAKALGIGQKNDPASTSLTAPTLHGPNLSGTSSTQYGIFSAPGVRPDMFSALTRPDSFLNLVALQPSRYTNEILEVMTGVTAAGGANATSFCGNPPEAGQGKVAQLTYLFGDFFAKTNLNALPKTGQRRNRADVPRNILNAPPENNPLIPDLMYRLDNGNSQLQYELWRLGVAIERSLETTAIQGTVGASTQWGWISEFDGLDQQIKTGYTDVTGVTVPALDSAVITFGVDVGGTIAGGDGRNLVQTVHDLVYGLRARGDKMGLPGFEMAVVMRREAFRSVVENYACNYATYRCDSGTAGNPINQSAETTNRLRLEMMRGRYLLVDDVPVPVVFSEGIPQTIIGNNNFQSDIYVVPVSWMGVPLLRMEYFPMDNPDAQAMVNFPGGVARRGIMNNGMYMVGVRDTGLCDEFLFAASMRLILETPFLAGRIDNVEYVFRAPIRNSDPGDTYFYADGGVTYRS